MLQRGRQWRAQIGQRPVPLCASTRESEEALILSALAVVDQAIPAGLLAVIVPRHPQCFDAVAELIAAYLGLAMRATLFCFKR
jgi:3-deoxy-D-manno-octulosonic-acid transferase